MHLQNHAVLVYKILTELSLGLYSLFIWIQAFETF